MMVSQYTRKVVPEKYTQREMREVIISKKKWILEEALIT